MSLSKISKLSIQIYSDIHIELCNKLPELPVLSKYLFLAGDICYYSHPLFFPFFDYCSKNWEKVFYIAGNHEYYVKNKNFNELNFEYKYKIGERYKNIFYLENDFVALNEEINVYGTTFWTKPPFQTTNEAKIYLNDYNWITYFNKDLNKIKNLDINFINELSKESFKKLQLYLNQQEKKTIIMTHFPPLRTGTSEPKYLLEKKTTDLYFSWPDKTIDDFNLYNVSAWISGHTHWSYEFEKNGTKFIGNQVGYKNEYGNTKINELGVYEIDLIS